MKVTIYFNKIDVFEGTDVNKTSESKECDICHDKYFLKKVFKFQPNVCNWCHDLSIIFMNHIATMFQLSLY